MHCVDEKTHAKGRGVINWLHLCLLINLPCLFVFLCLALGPLQSNAKIDGLGVVLLPGETKCFYEDVMSSTPSEREVQVSLQCC